MKNPVLTKRCESREQIGDHRRFGSPSSGILYKTYHGQKLRQNQVSLGGEGVWCTGRGRTNDTLMEEKRERKDRKERKRPAPFQKTWGQSFRARKREGRGGCGRGVGLEKIKRNGVKGLCRKEVGGRRGVQRERVDGGKGIEHEWRGGGGQDCGP